MGPIAKRRLLPVAAGAAAIAGLVLLRVLFPDPADRARLAVFDLFQRSAPRVLATASPVRIVDIDEESLKRHGQWPWPRSMVAELVANLQDLGAAAIALDMVFPEADRTSPAALAAHWRDAYGWHATTDRPLPDHDRILAETFARGRVVTGYGLLPQVNEARALASPPLAAIGADPALSIQGFGGAVANLEALDAAAAGWGSFTIAPGRDEIVRRLPLLSAVGGRIVPSLSVEALRVAQDESTLKVRSEGAPSGPVTGYTLRIGGLDVPLDADGTLPLHHAGTASGRMIAAWRLLGPEKGAALRQEIGGRIVLVGTSAVGLSDLRPTPLNAFEPGVAIHAEAIEQMAGSHFLIRPAWMPGGEVVGAIALALAFVLVAAFAPTRVAALVCLVLLAFTLVGPWLAFTQMRILVDPSLTAASLVLGFVVTGTARHLLVERDASRLRTAFSHYLSPALVTQLVQEPDRLRLGGEVRPMTFVFTDLEGFTALTEQHGPEALVSLLNRYLDGLCAVAMEHGGTVDKIVGDAVHVMFNAPLDQPDHAARAVACALAMDAFGTRFRDAQRAQGMPFGATRIGVNTGRALVGNFGGTRRFDYTAHGDAINTAARLEAANKTLGTRICVSAATVAQCPGTAFRPVGTLLLRGKAEGVEVHEPLRAEEADRHAPYVAAFARLRAGETAAEADLLALHAADPADPILALHARRLAAGERSVRIAA